MTPRSSKTRGALPRRLGLFFCLVVAGCLLAGGVAGAAQGDLTLGLGPLNLSNSPQASVVLQLGGEAAANIGDLSKDSVTVQVDGKTVPVGSLQAAGEGVAAPVETVLLIDESGSMKGEAITAAADAASRFIDAMRPGDLAAVQAFNEEFRTLQTFTERQGRAESLSGQAGSQEGDRPL